MALGAGEGVRTGNAAGDVLAGLAGSTASRKSVAVGADLAQRAVIRAVLAFGNGRIARRTAAAVQEVAVLAGKTVRTVAGEAGCL